MTKRERELYQIVLDLARDIQSEYGDINDVEQIRAIIKRSIKKVEVSTDIVDEAVAIMMRGRTITFSTKPHARQYGKNRNDIELTRPARDTKGTLHPIGTILHPIHKRKGYTYTREGWPV